MSESSTISKDNLPGMPSQFGRDSGPFSTSQYLSCNLAVADSRRTNDSSIRNLSLGDGKEGLLDKGLDTTIYVTKPFLPPLDEVTPYLEQIWKNGILTNGGPFHEELESRLADFLGVPYVSLCSNGTLALLMAIKALNISGEVITTPYSFIATSHVLAWQNITPVFVDIRDDTLNLDPAKIEAAITPRTTAIMPVHVYGTPCDRDAIQEIADRHHLKVLYDAAHAFGVEDSRGSILNAGNLSVLSFHATKVFNTLEGGAVIAPDYETKRHIDRLKNFGFQDEALVTSPGINAKMNEVQAAIGLVQLKYVKESIAKRAAIAHRYSRELEGIPGLKIVMSPDGITSNFSYFPIRINADEAQHNREQVFQHLRQKNIFARRYFYPLITQSPVYNSLDSVSSADVSVAEQVTDEILCLPIYPELKHQEQTKIISCLRQYLL